MFEKRFGSVKKLFPMMIQFVDDNYEINCKIKL